MSIATVVERPEPGRAGHDDQTVVLLRQPSQRDRKVQLIERRHPRLHAPDDQAEAAPLAMQVHAEAPEPGDAVREVHLAVLEKLALAIVGHELVHDALELTGRARLRRAPPRDARRP